MAVVTSAKGDAGMTWYRIQFQCGFYSFADLIRDADVHQAIRQMVQKAMTIVIPWPGDADTEDGLVQSIHGLWGQHGGCRYSSPEFSLEIAEGDPIRYQCCPFCMVNLPAPIMAKHLNDDRTDHRLGATYRGWVDPVTSESFEWGVS